MAAMTFTAGVILDSLARSRAELLRIHYMDLPALSASRDISAATPLFAESPQKQARSRKSKADAA